MRRLGKGELVPFDPEPERTAIDYVEREKKAQVRHQATMQNREERNQGRERNESQGGNNGNNSRNNAP